MKKLLSESEYLETMDTDAIYLLTQPSTCAPCRRFKPVFEAAAESFTKDEVPVEMYVIDIDDQTNPRWVMKLGYAKIPSVWLVRAGTTTELNQRNLSGFLDEVLSVLDNEPPF